MFENIRKFLGVEKLTDSNSSTQYEVSVKISKREIYSLYEIACSELIYKKFPDYREEVLKLYSKLEKSLDKIEK